MRLRSLWFKAVLSGVWLATLIPFAPAYEGHKPKPPEPAGLPRNANPSQDREARQRNYFTDLELITQDGQEVRFYTDILKNKVVLINFFFTNCVAACPLQSKVLADLQLNLGDQLGKEIFLVSISVDPGRDTPVAMKEYAENFAAQKGWIFLSGKKDRVNWVIYQLGQYIEEVDAHSTAYILGNAQADHWKKARPDATAKELASLLLSLVEENRLAEKKPQALP